MHNLRVCVYALRDDREAQLGDLLTMPFHIQWSWHLRANQKHASLSIAGCTVILGTDILRRRHEVASVVIGLRHVTQRCNGSQLMANDSLLIFVAR